MAPHPAFALLYSPVVRDHLRRIDNRFHSLIRKTIEERLGYEPNIGARNRKPLRNTELGIEMWEIRFGPGNRFRVFYQVNVQNHADLIQAIGEKVGEKLWIGGEEYEL